METIDIFKIPMFSGKINLNVKPLINKINVLKKQNPVGNINSSVGGWQHSLPNNFDNEMIDQISNNVNHFAKELKLKNPLKLNNIWVNVNEYSNYNRVHIHPRSQLSGVFYLKAPKNSGNIVFMNPVGQLLNYDWGGIFIEEYNHYTSYTYSYISENLKLYIFPGWLPHFVEPSKNKKEERISVSFNYSL